MVDQIGVLYNIEKKLGKDVRDIVDELSYESNIYLLYIVSVRATTQRDLDIGFAKYHASFPDRPYESYMKHVTTCKEDKFRYGMEPQGYFLNEKTAIEYAEKNMGDINEAGSFPYVIISSMPLNRVYPVCNTRTHRIFLFDEEFDGYREVNWSYNEETKYLESLQNSCAY